jgi:hypothetical protein
MHPASFGAKKFCRRWIGPRAQAQMAACLRSLGATE